MTKSVVPKKPLSSSLREWVSAKTLLRPASLSIFLAGTNALGSDLTGSTVPIARARPGLARPTISLSPARVRAETGRPASQSKCAQQVTSGGFPANFVGVAWAQWFGIEIERALQNRSDALVLMTGSLAHDLENAWSNLLGDALSERRRTDRAQFLAHQRHDAVNVFHVPVHIITFEYADMPRDGASEVP
jgi:hypothetical protein